MADSKDNVVPWSPETSAMRTYQVTMVPADPNNNGLLEFNVVARANGGVFNTLQPVHEWMRNNGVSPLHWVAAAITAE